MRITKRQLRRIIREEKRKVLAERKVRRIVRRRLLEQAAGGAASLASELIGNVGPETFLGIQTMAQGKQPVLMIKADVPPEDLTDYGFKGKPTRGPNSKVPKLHTYEPEEFGYTIIAPDMYEKHATSEIELAEYVRDAGGFVNDADLHHIETNAASSSGKQSGGAKLNFDALPWDPGGDPELDEVIGVANSAGANLGGEIVDEDSDVDIKQLDAMASAFKQKKSIPHETADGSGTLKIGTVNGNPVAVWTVMGHSTWIR